MHKSHSLHLDAQRRVVTRDKDEDETLAAMISETATRIHDRANARDPDYVSQYAIAQGQIRVAGASRG
jgi:hypothetical protein